MSERAKSLDQWADRVLSHIPLETTGEKPDFGTLFPSSSHFSGEMIFGREGEKCKLIDFLLSDPYTSYCSVMAVVGMAGIGKTTLAQLVFNDERVSNHFELKIWIYVSHNFDILRLTKSLIESIEGQTCNLVELDTLQKKLHELVRGRGVLLVLDDVWTDNLQMWQVFTYPLRTERIKIIVTTQSESSAVVMQTVPTFKLEMLPEDACMEILNYHAFGSKRGIPVIQGDEDIVQKKSLVELENDCPELLKADIKKCQGLPLAVKELGHRVHNVTRYGSQHRSCHDVLRADFNPAVEFTTGMFSSLKLSYDLLPSNLKRCIAYCSLFPEDYVYKKDHLARLWAAQGYVQIEGEAILGDVTREDVCRGCFDELVRRSFFLPIDSDLGEFIMHGLIHRLCKHVSANEAFSFEKSELLQTCPQLQKEIRHLYIASDQPIVVPDHVPLRTYIYNGVRFDDEDVSGIRMDMLHNLKYVRSVELTCHAIENLPDSFGSLKYLKYLRLNCSLISELPESIGDLYNLQMLDLCGCKGLRELPPSIGNLIELWCLELPPIELREGVVAIGKTCRIPREIGRLTSLRTLPGIVLTKGLRHLCGIRELKGLVKLRGEFYIAGLENLTDVDEAFSADLKAKKFLDVLRLKWSSRRYYKPLWQIHEYRILENLEPHKNLRELHIIGYFGYKFPEWLSDSSFSNLTKMALVGCAESRCHNLPALGQLPSLKCLSIECMPSVVRLGMEFCYRSSTQSLPSTRVKAFPCLVEISFEDMKGWKGWYVYGCGEFPVLRKLTVKNCPYLNNLPYFPLLTELNITSCHRLEYFLLHNSQYSQLPRRKRTQDDMLVELPTISADDMLVELPTISGDDNSLPHNEKDKQKNIVKGSPSDVYHTNYKVANSPIWGREKDANRIIEVLLSDKSREHNVNVNFMCVVAPSGVGKTTIIHHVFNKHTISEAFDTRVWVCIYRVLDEKALMKEIIESITHLSCVRADLSLLHEIVQEELSGKKFLLILDGAENENLIDWSSVCTVLNVGAKGSMVVVATKSRVVVDAINSEHCHFLENLSDHNCWSIFSSLNPKFPSFLRERCKHLVEKCEGIPLCIKMVGGCFHTAMTEKIIMDVSESKSWETDELGSGILPALRVCYEFLSFELRKCFAYCALFPKDHVFVKDHIVRLWMSQGFIDHSGVEKLEEIGVRYFDELVSRSFLQVSPIHDEKDDKFLMHELVHDLAECISFNECLRSEDCSLSTLENVSHLALAPYEVKNVKLSMVKEKNRKLKTFMVLNRFTPQLYNLINSPIVNLSGLKDFLENHTDIKTLDLSDTDIDMLPESIILLKSLQFLGINNRRVKNIPPEICTHGKLQTLEARNCCNLVELPANLKELTSLRHLDTRKESGFVAIPRGIRYLTNLRTLSSFNVGNGESHSSIKELKNLKHLKGEIRITGLENIESGNEAKEAELERKKSLKILVLEWCGRSGEKTEEFSKQVLGYLQPPSNLQEIVIRNYTGTQFPLWVENRLFPNLVSITLDNCFNCDKFPNFGNLPSLKYLCAQKMHLVQNLGESASSSRSTKDPKFLSLEVLKLSEMYGLMDLFQIENMDFPRLYSLSISRCPMLGKIPRFASLVELSVSCCTKLPDISDLSSVEFLKIDRVENLEVLVVWKLNMLKKLEISNCGELKSVQYLSDQPLTVKAKCFRCPKLTFPNNWKNVSIEKELEVVRDSSEDCDRSFGKQYEESDDYLLEDY